MNEEGARISTLGFLDRAQRFSEVERYDLAETTLREGLVAAPDHPLLHFELGRCLAAQERWDEAREELRVTLAQAPDMAEAHGLLSVVESNENRFHSAEKAIHEALRIDPTLAWLYEVYGNLMFRTGHLDKARRLFEKALELDPESSSAHAGLARVHGEKHQKGAAHHHGHRGLNLAPGDDVNHFAMGMALFETGHPFRARRHLREALRIDPSDEEVEEVFLHVDSCCRWIYLPMYYYSLAMERIPGRQLTLWGAFLVVVFGLPQLGVPEGVVNGIAITYIATCLYTWISGSLVKPWVRLFPPK